MSDTTPGGARGAPPERHDAADPAPDHHPSSAPRIPTPPGSPDAFHLWAEAAERIRATTKRLEKLAVLTAYFPTLDDDDLAVAARFFSGVPFARHDMRTTRVGGSLLSDAIATAAGVDRSAIGERYVGHGDLGDVAFDLLAGRASSAATLAEISAWMESLAAASGTKARRALLEERLSSLGPLEARYLVRLLAGEPRIGLKEAQVEEAVARAFGQEIDLVRRANLLRGDIGEVAVLAREGGLARARLALFHPIGFMLAQPLATAEEIAEALPAPFSVEDKYDGIRAQAHVEGERVALFSRTLDDITHGYPDVVEALRSLASNAEAGGSLILDGELLAHDPDEPTRALPFRALQRRLGRKKPDAELLADVPATFVAYDILAERGQLVIDEPYERRRLLLEQLPWPGPGARLTPRSVATNAEEVNLAFDAARRAGNEGIIAKDPSSIYTPGRRGKTWIKLKRAMATLDVVIVRAERGHGRRRAVLSDYTFAVRASETDPTLLTVGKAYNGLTDLEIVEMTRRLEGITTRKDGRYHDVVPEVVLEVTFDIVQPSARHSSGFALRFPRIVRVRDDKPASEVDTLARVRELAAECGDDGSGESRVASGEGGADGDEGEGGREG